MDYPIVISTIALVCCLFLELGRTLLSAYARSNCGSLTALLPAAHAVLPGRLLIALSHSVQAVGLFFYDWVFPRPFSLGPLITCLYIDDFVA